jgi:hypothetical protein
MPDELSVLIESNVAEFLLTMGRTGGGSERADDEITWTVGGSPIGYSPEQLWPGGGSDGARRWRRSPLSPVATRRATDIGSYRRLVAGYQRTAPPRGHAA